MVTEKRAVEIKEPNGTLILDGFPENVLDQTFFVEAGFSIVSIDRTPSGPLWQTKLIGSEITLSQQGQAITGILKSIAGGSAFLEANGNSIYIPDLGQYRISFEGKAPVLKPESGRILRYSGAKTGTENVVFAYQLPGISWSTMYDMQWSDASSQLNIRAWAQIQNNTGHDFGNVNIRLLAGDVSRQTPSRPPRPMVEARAMMMAKAADESLVADESPVSEYYSFDIKEKIALTEAPMRKVLMFDAKSVKVKKSFVFDAYPEEDLLKPVLFTISLNNTTEQGLGRVFPAGTARVYTRDDRYMTLLGELFLKNLPVGGSDELQLGRASDVLASHWVAESKQVNPRVRDESMLYRISNKKKEAVTVVLRKETGNQATITSSDVTWAKPRAGRIESTIMLKPGEERLVKLNVRYNYE